MSTIYNNYSISAGKGKLYMKAKQPTEGFEKVTYGTNGESVTYHKYAESIKGVPSLLEVKEISYEGKTLKFMELTLTDGEVLNKVSAPLKNIKGNYTDEVRALLSALNNLDLGEEVTLTVKATTTTGKNGKEYTRLDLPRFQKYIVESGFGNMFPKISKGDYVPESLFYLLGMKANNKTAQNFQQWLAIDVIPKIRQTGGYIPQDENDTDEDILAKAVIIAKKTIDNKNKIIESQKKEIEYKGNIITGFTDEISLAEKRQVLNRVVRQGSDYKKRYGELYYQFNLLYHIDLNRRLEGYQEKYQQLDKKERKRKGIKRIDSKMAYIDEILHMIPELYEVAVKIYESDVEKLVDELYSLRN